MRNTIKYGSPLVLLFLFIFLASFKSPGKVSDKIDHSKQKSEEQAENLDPGEIIIDHVVDHYSWHIVTIGEKHISIPLPVILYSKDRGFFCFMSSKFHHGHESYKKFKIAEVGPNKGSIVELNSGGEVKEELPLDFSLTKTAAGIMVSILLMIIVFISIANSYKRRRNSPPRGIQSLLEPLIIFVRDECARPGIGEEDYEKYTPYLLTLFFFILFNNLLGLIPIFPAGANTTGNITVTMGLALFTFFITIFSGKKEYWREIFNPPSVPWWLKLPFPLIPIIEVTGIFTKHFVLMIRLFANISAGHIVMLGFFTLIFIFGNMNVYAGYGISVFSIVFTIFLTLLELLVAFIQAYVFTILAGIYFGMALGKE